MNTQEFGKFVAYKDAALILPFVEGRGLPHDFSKNCIKPTFSNGVWKKGSMEFATGRYINFENKYEPKGSFSLVARFKPRDFLRLGQRLIIKDNGSTAGFALSFNDAGTNGLRFYIREISPIILDSKTKFKYIKYITGISVFDLKSKKLHVNKHLERSLQTTGTLTSITNPLCVGGYPSQGGYFIGHITDARIYDRDLSYSEVKSVDYYLNSKPKPTAITKRGCFQAVKNTGIEVDGKLTSCCGI